MIFGVRSDVGGSGRDSQGKTERSMLTIDFAEAQVQWSELLARVARGESIAITKGGKPVAHLVPAPVPAEPSAGTKEPRPDIRKVIEEFRAYSRQQNRTLGDLTFREMIDEGRP